MLVSFLVSMFPHPLTEARLSHRNLTYSGETAFVIFLLKV
jgi:hypothetical protein